MVVLQALLGSIATACFLCLCVYIYLASRGDSITLYCTVDMRLMTRGRKVFLVLAAVGFLTCMYAGAYAMLYWIPSEWGSIDEDGTFTSARMFLAACFSFFGGLVLAGFIDKASHNRVFLRELQAERTELRDILQVSLSAQGLDSLELRYSDRIESLRSQLGNRKGGSTFAAHAYPEGQAIQRYRELIALIELQRLKLRSIQRATGDAARGD